MHIWSLYCTNVNTSYYINVLLLRLSGVFLAQLEIRQKAQHVALGFYNVVFIDCSARPQWHWHVLSSVMVRLHISSSFFKSHCTIYPPFPSVTFTHSPVTLSSVHTHTQSSYFTLTTPHYIHSHTHIHTTYTYTNIQNVQLHCESLSLLFPLLCCVKCNYSTVTDLAKFLGKSTCKKMKQFVSTNNL